MDTQLFVAIYITAALVAAMLLTIPAAQVKNHSSAMRAIACLCLGLIWPITIILTLITFLIDKMEK